MKIDINSVRVGDILKHDKRLWLVMKTTHTQPGKGGAYMQVVMKDIINATKLDQRFSTSDTIEKAYIEQKSYQYLFMDGDDLVVMDTQNYDQISVTKHLLDNKIALLQDGMILKFDMYEDKPIAAHLPKEITVCVLECEPVVKGQTASSSYKPATVDGGLRIMVPPFINQGDKIVIKSEELEYLERA